MVATGLGCTVGAMGVVFRCLVEEVVAVGFVAFAGSHGFERRLNAFGVVHGEGTIDFVGRDVVKSLAFVLFGQRLPIELGGLEQ